MSLAGEELVGHLGNDVQSHDGEDEAQRHDHDDNGVDPKTRGLVGVELEHGARGAARAGGAGGRWSLGGHGSLSFLVGASPKDKGIC